MGATRARLATQDITFFVATAIRPRMACCRPSCRFTTLQALSGTLSAHDAQRVRGLLATYLAGVKAVCKLPLADPAGRTRLNG